MVGNVSLLGGDDRKTVSGVEQALYMGKARKTDGKVGLVEVDNGINIVHGSHKGVNRGIPGGQAGVKSLCTHAERFCVQNGAC